MGRRAKKLLIVDDDEDLLDIYANILSEEGYEVVGVASTEQVVECFRRGPPDVMLVDCLMRRTSGRELLGEVREQIPDLFKSTRVFMFTSLNQASPQAQEMQAVVDGYIEKPIDLYEFLDLLNALFEGKQDARIHWIDRARPLAPVADAGPIGSA